MRELKVFWGQEVLEFCRPDGTNPAHQELIEILKEEIGDGLCDETSHA